MDISSYFDPIDINKIDFRHDNIVPRIGDRIDSYTVQNGRFPLIEKRSVVLIGVTDGRGTTKGLNCGNAADMIRRYLYRLAEIENGPKIIDLGNLTQGETISDTRQALADVTAEIIRNNGIVVVIGGGNDYTWSLYKAYAQIGRVLNMAAIDSRFDIDEQRDLDSHNYLRYIIMDQPNYLFNYTNIGYQTYFVGQQHIGLMEELKFDIFRLGWVRENIERAEPLLRNADSISVDIGAIRQSDAPANTDPSPHGFYGEELCEMMRYAGMSDKTSSLGIFEFSPMHDNSGQTAHLIAHAIWYFTEGVSLRKDDHPYRDTENYRKVIVPLTEQDVEIVFYKSKKSDRWWIEIPCSSDTKDQGKRHLLIPCLYSDYEQSLENKIPDLWWKYYQKLNS